MPSSALSLFDLSGQVAVVTGGNRGIGFGMARGLARAGADLALWARDETQSEAAAAELRAMGGRVETIRCDVSQEEDVIRAADETVERMGKVDIGIANAGFGAADEAEWKRNENAFVYQYGFNPWV